MRSKGEEGNPKGMLREGKQYKVNRIRRGSYMLSIRRENNMLSIRRGDDMLSIRKGDNMLSIRRGDNMLSMGREAKYKMLKCFFVFLNESFA